MLLVHVAARMNRNKLLKAGWKTIDGLLRAGIRWPVIHSSTGIDEPAHRILKRAAAPGTEQTAPRQ